MSDNYEFHPENAVPALLAAVGLVLFGLGLECPYSRSLKTYLLSPS